MRKKLNILSRFNEWTQDSNPLKRMIAQTWSKLVLESRYRFSSSVTISIVVHLFLFLSYLGMGVLDQSEEPPIREITFIDMNEVEEEPEKVIIKKERPPIIKDEIPPPPEEDQEPSYAPKEQSTSKIALGKDRLFLDTQRKQAPINVQQYEPAAGNVQQSKDMLNISSAIGIKKDDRTSKPAALDLGKEDNMLLASAAGPSQAVSFGKSGKPQIDLNPAKNSISSGSVSSKIPHSKPKPIQTKPDLKPKKTQTIITGDLANREILSKEIPHFPYWAITKGVGATISLRFTVMENGLVKETVIVERTSGSLQWDQMVISALKKWKFIPLKQAGLRQNQSGVITFQFVI